MQIGYVGLGKIGLPMALIAESKGHQLFGYDKSQRVLDIIRTRKLPYQEIGIQELLDKTNISLGGVDHVVSNCDLVFCAVQTPHSPEYEGVTRLPETRADFDYTYLIQSVKEICQSCAKLKKHITLVVMCTVLPGTIDREIKPLLNQYTYLIYNPVLVAMGRVLPDYLHPEFVLIGSDDGEAEAGILKAFYSTIHGVKSFVTSIRTAELIKVCYNTFITTKICYINTMMEICHKIGANIDDVSDALAMATDRIASAKYMRGGMGDAGPCHCRDNIAMSWLADELGLSHNIFDDIMQCREDQCEWLADLIVAHKANLPVVILGKAFKPDSNIVTGSAGILLANILREKGVEFVHLDPQMGDEIPSSQPSIFFIATKHTCFEDWSFPPGSVVLDPHRYIPKKEGVIRIGANEV